ncbi:MAG: hypothetical protein A2Y80_02115 [Deltaproteobacteria bacterium RBG_13_58_19]|nr:MAG: hypothetical protein A2Y80_02115 [Deltaproteobacteria bacterium RBG_13_58_19]
MLNENYQQSQAPWSPAERAAWAPPEDITVSEWAAAHRVLPSYAAISGTWKNTLAPYAVGVMDAFNDPYKERITIMASAQSVKTESAYNMLGFAICQDPGPALVVLPTHSMMKKANRRLRIMLKCSHELARHLTGNLDDLTLAQLSLDVMDIHCATAGSEADLQFVEARYLILDETDLYPPGGVKQAIDRATTYWNRKIIDLSRPTVPEGHINTEYGRSDQRKYWVPCPFCGEDQVLSFWQIKHQGEVRGAWPREKRDPEYIKLNRVARYECQHCQAEIDDRDKPKMLAKGIWVPEGMSPAQVRKQGTLPPVAHAGFWWNVLYSPFKNFSEIAAEFFQVKDTPEDYRVFVNQWLAEPWKETVQEQQASAILELRTNRPALEVPDGALGLTVGIDNQKRGFWYSIWAWVLTESGLLDQHLVRYGFVGDFEELEICIFQDVYHVRGGGISHPVWRGAIDTGGGEDDPGKATLTEQVYSWLRRVGRGRIFGVKGAARALAGGKKMQMSIIDKMPGKGLPIPGGLRVWILDTHALKDAFWSRVETGRVHLHADTDEIFASHLAAEAKERDGKGRLRWVLQGRRANHLLDTAIYATAMADPECWGGVMVLPRQGAAAAKAENPELSPWLGGRSRGWLGR